MNDVANVNIDAKLIRSNKNRDRESNQNTTADLADTIELANGCACAPAPLLGSHQRTTVHMLSLLRPQMALVSFHQSLGCFCSGHAAALTLPLAEQACCVRRLQHPGRAV